MKKTTNRTGLAIWGWPMILGVLTSVGLVAGLFSDGGAGDVAAGICLALPVVVGIWFGWCRPGPKSSR
ncbi:hypothetical protein [Chitinolyticbacter meiyuanensis]|uniref:hypothetical protein n=1 Tax=Chitinolyticbacter meiyuanensis TaxID=682798 RepID=UPI0011E5B47D|nr:hypothetical protein [Chitinolyticbacter meiyuanensis]